jgi:multidrug transporter EmrE-like cation transporter
MRRDSKKAFFVIIGLLLFYVPVKLLGDAVQWSDLPLWVAYPIYFLLGVVSVVVIWAAVNRLDR